MARDNDELGKPGGLGFPDGDKWMQPFDCPPQEQFVEWEHGWIEDKKKVDQPRRKQREMFLSPKGM